MVPRRCPILPFPLTSQRDMPIFELLRGIRWGHPPEDGFLYRMFTGCWCVPPGPSGSLFFSIPASFAVPPQKILPTPSLSGRHTRDISPSEKRELPFSQTAYAKPLTPCPKALHPLFTSLRTKASQDARIQVALRKYKGIPPLCQVLFSAEVIFFLCFIPI